MAEGDWSLSELALDLESLPTTLPPNSISLNWILQNLESEIHRVSGKAMVARGKNPLGGTA